MFVLEAIRYAATDSLASARRGPMVCSSSSTLVISGNIPVSVAFAAAALSGAQT